MPALVAPLPKAYLSLEKVVLIAQKSLKEELLRLKPGYFRTGPTIFDCESPLIGMGGELLLSPFLGHVGICTILEQLFLQASQFTSVNFFGTCGSIETSEHLIGDVVQPSSYYVELLENNITPIIPGEEFALLSTMYFSTGSFAKLNDFYTTRKIAYLDMEAAFVCSISKRFDIEFRSNLIISDIFRKDQVFDAPKKITSLLGFNNLVESLLANLK